MPDPSLVISTLPISPREKLDIIRAMNQVLEALDIKSLRVHFIIEKKWKLKFFKTRNFEKNSWKPKLCHILLVFSSVFIQSKNITFENEIIFLINNFQISYPKTNYLDPKYSINSIKTKTYFEICNAKFKRESSRGLICKQVCKKCKYQYVAQVIFSTM